MTKFSNSQSEQQKSQLFTVRRDTLAPIAGRWEHSLPFTLHSIVDHKYEVLSLLAEGGMGAVYRVRHLTLNKPMALKTFRTTEIAPRSWQLFQQEAQTIAKLDNPNVVQVFDFGIADEKIPYYTMELLQGESLAARLTAEGRLPLQEAVEIFLQVAEALSVVNKRGIVHGDIKPANIILEAAPHQGGAVGVKLVDFGIAKLTTEHPDDKYTTGEIYGSPLYMSPEQFQGRRLTAASDIYSFACSLFETIVGKVPFHGETAYRTMELHLTTEAPRLSQYSLNETVPQRLEGLLAGMLAKSCQDRPASFAEVVTELKSIRRSLAHRPKQITDNTEDQNPSPPAATSLLNKLFSRQAGLLIAAIAGLCTIALITGQPKEGESNLPRIDAGQFDKTKRANVSSRSFEFPPGMCLGELSSVPSPQVRRSASGNVSIQTDVIYYPNELVSSHPELLIGFNPYSLAAVETHTNRGFDERHIQILSSWLALKRLSLKGSRLSPACMPMLDRMPALTSLSVTKSAVTAQDLNKMRTMERFQTLELSGLRNAGLLFATHQGLPDLCYLHLNDCGLTDQDLTSIAKCRNLIELKLAKNPGITDEGIPPLLSLQKLITLDLRGTSIGSPAIKKLSRMKALRMLSLTTTNFDDADLEELKRNLPNCTID